MNDTSPKELAYHSTSAQDLARRVLDVCGWKQDPGSDRLIKRVEYQNGQEARFAISSSALMQLNDPRGLFDAHYMTEERRLFDEALVCLAKAAPHLFTRCRPKEG